MGYRGILLLACFFAGSASAAVMPSGSPRQLTSQQAATLAIPFLPNQGQADSRVAFYAPLFIGTVFVTRDGKIVYSLPAAKPATRDGHPDTGWTLTEQLMTSSTLKPQAGEQGGASVNYFVGRDPTHWQHGLPTYDGVSLGQAWPGIEVSLTAHADHVETFYKLAAGADVNRIRLKLSGAKALKIKHGLLLAETGLGQVAFDTPKAWQTIRGERQIVPVHYVLHHNSYGFALGAHDAAAPVVIDPDFQATYLGGSSNGNDINSLNAMSLAPNGDIYVAGQTNATDFPGTTGGAQAKIPTGGFDVAFVARLDPTLSVLKQATYLGGTKQIDDYALAIAIDAGGDVYITGFTACTDFPVTAGAAQTAFSGGLDDGFVAKFSADLKTLDQATYLGGTGDELAYGIAIGSGGDVYVAGTTSSTDFPGTGGGAQASAGGGGDAFVAKLDAGLTTVEQSTYLGGSGFDSALAITLDSSGNVYVAGRTESSDLPGTSGGAQPAIGVSVAGNTNAFVAKLDSTLTILHQATYLGGSSAAVSSGVFGDWATAIAIGPKGDVYITGQAVSADFPGTTGGAQALIDGAQDAFVAKFTADLSILEQATYLGGSGMDGGETLGFDLSGNVLVGGGTGSSDFPGTSGGAQPTLPAWSTGFVAKLSPDLSTLDQATYLGGSGSDSVAALTVDSSGNVYAAGSTNSVDFPGTAGGAQASFGSADDSGFIAKLPPDLKAQTSLDLYFGTLPGSQSDVNLTSLLPSGSDDLNIFVTDESADTDASGIVITVTLPSELTPQFTMVDSGYCDIAGQTVTCHISLDLQPGNGGDIQILTSATTPGSGDVVAEVTHVDQDLASGSTTSAQLGVVVGGGDTTANAGSITTAPDQAVNGTLSASNPCACGTPTYKIDTQPSDGTVSITNASTGAFTYTPAKGYAGADTFSFELDNGVGAATPATIQVTVQDVAPTTTGSSLTVDAGTGASVSLTGTAAYAGQVWGPNIVSPPAHGKVQCSVGQGCFYAPNLAYVGADNFTFDVTDQYGTASNVSTVQVTVKDPGIVADPGSASTTPDQAVTGTVTTFYIVFGQTLDYAVVAQPKHGTVVMTAANGNFTYTPATGYTGVDSFTYKVTDNFGAVSGTEGVDILVNDVAPTATGASIDTLPSTSVSGTLSATAAYVGQTLTYSIVQQPANGSVSVTAATGKFTYTPDTGYTGPDSFEFKVADQYIKSATATDSVTVGDIAPTANGGSVSTLPDTAVSGALSATLAYPTQQLSYVLASNPAHGSVSLTTSTGQFKYTPTTGFAGTDSFTFQAKDALGTLSGVTTETVTVNDIAPKATNGSAAGGLGRTISGSLKATTAYPGQVLDYSAVTHPSHGTLTINPTTGAYTYKPSAGYVGTDLFTFEVTDLAGTASNTARFVVSVW